MEVPDIVARELGEGEVVATSVSLGGEDRLLVTPRRSVVYRAGGVLSDESVESLPHDVERLTVSEGRRKATLGVEYPIEADREVAVPLDRVEAVLQPLLAAVLQESEVTAPGERVHRVFSFSELTLVVTDERLFKHVGAALWDDEYEQIRFEAVTDLAYEEGAVATGVVLTVDGRVERMKAPNDRLPEMRETVESALLAAHDADSVDDLDDGTADETGADGATADPGAAVADFGGVDALDAGDDQQNTPTGDGTPEGAVGATETGGDGDAATGNGSDATSSASSGSPESHEAGEKKTETADDAAATDDVGETTETTETTETSGTDDGRAEDDVDASTPDTPFTESVEPDPAVVEEELSELRAAVERQNELLQRHGNAIERLVETLREK